MSDKFENNSNGFEPYNGSQNENPQTENQNESYDPIYNAQENDQSAGFDSGENNASFENPQSYSDSAYDPYYSAGQGQGYSQNPQNNPYGYAQNGYNQNGGQGGYQNPVNYQYGPYQQEPQNQPTEPYNFSNAAPFSAPPQNNNGGQKKSAKGKLAAAIVIVLVVAVGLIIAVQSLLPEKSEADAPDTTTAQGETSAIAGATAASGDNKLQYSTTNGANTQALSAVDVAEKARASVVGVMTYQNGQLSGEGSGVVMGVDSTGKYTYVITCAHVISERGATFGVSTLDGKKYEAQMVATDARTDIGVLKVEATDLPVAQFGDSSTLKVGETVYAIGNPGGSEYFGSMTNGIISAIDRSVSGTYTMTCIQHNAAINPGNSGGALVNSAGQVIGINSSKIAATDYEGMGFAIPVATVKTVVDNLIEHGYVPNRPKLGIQYTSVDNYQLYSMVVAIKNLPAGSLVIAGISKESSLANTDAQVGDLIIGVNGKKMDTSDVLLDLIDTGAVGDKITLNLCRVDNRTYQTKTFDVTITLIEDKGDQEEETTTAATGEYDYGGSSSFEDFFKDYFGGFGGFGN